MNKFILFCLLLNFPFMITFAQSPLKIAVIGNSITEGPGREHQDSYPIQLGAILGEAYEVRNFGVSGRTLLKKGDFPFWDEPQFEEAKDFAADIVLIKLGTNDTKPQNWEHKNEFKSDFMELISEMRKSMPKDGKIFVVIPVPVFKDNFGINKEVMDNQLKPILYDIAESTGSEVIDLYTPLLTYGDLFPDGIHPNTEGLTIMAETLAKALQR